MRNFRGFTLVELMTVVGIVAVLASVAIPNYSSYNVKSKVSEAYQAVAPIQQTFANAFSQTGSLLQANAAAATDASGLASKYVNSVTMGACTGSEQTCGEIIVTVNGANTGVGSNSTLVLKAQQLNSGSYVGVPVQTSNSPIDWGCFSTTHSTATALGMVNSTTTPTLASKYVPSQCQ